MVQKQESTKPTFFRGVNLEVSMPTGSLCAERNCIGTALAYDPHLARCDIKLIAVLSLPPVPSIASPELDLSTSLTMRSYRSNPPELNLGNSCVEAVLLSMFTPLYRVGSLLLLALGVLVLTNRLESKTVRRYRVKKLNPIDPCGACNEWLKKISEVQPQFRVINFIDESCAEIFVKRVC